MRCCQTTAFHSLTLTEVVSWRLHYDGTLSGMLADENKVENTPVFARRWTALYPAQSRQSFRYFFQHHIANKLKSPTTLRHWRPYRCWWITPKPYALTARRLHGEAPLTPVAFNPSRL